MCTTVSKKPTQRCRRKGDDILHIKYTIYLASAGSSSSPFFLLEASSAADDDTRRFFLSRCFFFLAFLSSSSLSELELLDDDDDDDELELVADGVGVEFNAPLDTDELFLDSELELDELLDGVRFFLFAVEHTDSWKNAWLYRHVNLILSPCLITLTLPRSVVVRLWISLCIHRCEIGAAPSDITLRVHLFCVAYSHDTCLHSVTTSTHFPYHHLTQLLLKSSKSLNKLLSDNNQTVVKSPRSCVTWRRCK